jgi:glucose-6-phosphate dehydrogenase assembly protein OpcA
MEDPVSVTAIRPEELLKALSGLWTELGKEEVEGSDRSAGVLRAVTMTFILGVEEGEEEGAGETLAQLMHEHPSRAIVIKLRKNGSEVVEGRAYAQCWMPFGRRQQICCEQIELSAGAKNLEDVASVLRGLIAPDLPVVFWCRSARLFEQKAYGLIAGMADKVILDTRGLGDPQAGVRYVAQLKLGRLYGDLTWTRLTRWRETIAHVFERIDCKEFLGSMERVVVKYTQTPEPMAVVYLKGWLRTVMGAGVKIESERCESEGSWQIREVRFESRGRDVVIDRVEKGIVESHIDSFRTRSVFEILDEARLVREELAILERDPIFARTIEVISKS